MHIINVTVLLLICTKDLQNAYKMGKIIYKVNARWQHFIATKPF
jgi:hypothetical protein